MGAFEGLREAVGDNFVTRPGGVLTPEVLAAGCGKIREAAFDIERRQREVRFELAMYAHLERLAGLRGGPRQGR